LTAWIWSAVKAGSIGSTPAPVALSCAWPCPIAVRVRVLPCPLGWLMPSISLWGQSLPNSFVGSSWMGSVWYNVNVMPARRAPYKKFKLP
jgi:hypothetical protein